MSWLAEYGSDAEKATLDGAYRAAKGALVARDADELERQLAVIRRLGNAAFFRHPRAWEMEFERCAAGVAESTDLRRAADLVAKGQVAMRAQDRAAIERVVRALWLLSPVDRDEQTRGHGSGLRSR